MFWLGLFVGFILGTNISLFLYALIINAKKCDKQINDMEMR